MNEVTASVIYGLTSHLTKKKFDWVAVPAKSSKGRPAYGYKFLLDGRPVIALVFGDYDPKGELNVEFEVKDDNGDWKPVGHWEIYYINHGKPNKAMLREAIKVAI